VAEELCYGPVPRLQGGLARRTYTVHDRRRVRAACEQRRHAANLPLSRRQQQRRRAAGARRGVDVRAAREQALDNLENQEGSAAGRQEIAESNWKRNVNLFFQYHKPLCRSHTTHEGKNRKAPRSATQKPGPFFTSTCPLAAAPISAVQPSSSVAFASCPASSAAATLAACPTRAAV